MQRDVLKEERIHPAVREKVAGYRAEVVREVQAAIGAVTLRGRLSYGFAIRDGIASYLRLERARVSTLFAP